MAPEQAEGHSDKRTDIYMLGALLYEMVTGTAARKKPLRFPDSVPAGVRYLVLKCLERNPDRRFQSVAELRNAPSEPVPSRLGSYKGIVAACLLVSLGLTGVLSRWMPRRQPVAAATGADSKRAVIDRAYRRQAASNHLILSSSSRQTRSAGNTAAASNHCSRRYNPAAEGYSLASLLHLPLFARTESHDRYSPAYRPTSRFE